MKSYVNIVDTSQEARGAYRIPRANIALSAALFALAVCSFHTTACGIDHMMISYTMLYVAIAAKSLFFTFSLQVPFGIEGSQLYASGLQTIVARSMT